MDLKATTVKSLRRAFNIFLQDLQALPEDAFCKSFSPKTRTVADIVYEVNLVNDHATMVIREEKPFEWPTEDWIKAPEGFDTKDAIIRGFEESRDKTIATIESFSAEQFEEPIKTEDGETNRFERCRFMTLHLWYHSGQLNFIQTLIGDDGWHWE